MYSTKKYIPGSSKTGCLVVPVFSGKKLSTVPAHIDKVSSGAISSVIKKGDFSGKQGQVALLYDLPGVPAERVLLVGAGAGKAMSPLQFRKFARQAIAAVRETSTKDATVLLEEINTTHPEPDWLLEEYIRLHGDAQYSFRQFKSKKQDGTPASKLCFGVMEKNPPKTAAATVRNAAKLVEGVNLAKDLGNLPGNVCTPSYLAKEARKLAGKSDKMSCKIVSEKELDKMGAGAFVSVAKGSKEEGKLIIMNYKGGKSGEAPHVLVGKGITFDTGGISLKPGAGMDEMKYDMCGAASVFGTMKAIASMGLKKNVIGVVAAAENMPDGTASKPGDIVKTLSGQTVEILNTDAEGRLVLCDALTYVERFKPASVVDIATLTGACVVALGGEASAVYANDEALSRELLDAGEKSGDRGWPMPMWEEYQSQLESPFADMANIGGPKGGSITAACFLSRYAKSYKWAHMDIAGTAWTGPGPKKGATGRPVSLLTRYLMDKKG